MPLRFMSRTRSWTSYTPGRISAKPAGSRPHSSAGHDTTALSPLTPCGLPWYIHWSTPLSSVTTIGASSLYLAGTWLQEHVRRLDDVVVDAHQDQVVGLHTSSSTVYAV